MHVSIVVELTELSQHSLYARICMHMQPPHGQVDLFRVFRASSATLHNTVLQQHARLWRHLVLLRSVVRSCGVLHICVCPHVSACIHTRFIVNMLLLFKHVNCYNLNEQHVQQLLACLNSLLQHLLGLPVTKRCHQLPDTHNLVLRQPPVCSDDWKWNKQCSPSGFTFIFTVCTVEGETSIIEYQKQNKTKKVMIFRFKCIAEKSFIG